MPHRAVNLHTYTELEAEADAFVGDHYDVLLIVGRPGVSKSEYFRKPARMHRKVMQPSQDIPVARFQFPTK